MKQAVLFLIRFYKSIIAPMTGPCCRFYPSCSTYAETAVQQKGILRGGQLAIRRILKCHPLHPGGFDPVER